MDLFLQHLVNAAILGGTYALLGIGLTLIFGIMNVVNFTHGELYAFGAYMVYFFAMVLGLNFFLALAAAIILGAALGAIFLIVAGEYLRPIGELSNFVVSALALAGLLFLPAGFLGYLMRGSGGGARGEWGREPD